MKTMRPPAGAERQPSPLVGMAFGALIGLPFIGLDYLGRQWAGLPFIPYDMFDWLARVLPGRVINSGIETMVRLITFSGFGPIDSVAKGIEQGVGVAVVVAAAGLVGGGMALILGRTTWRGERVGATIGAVAFLCVSVVDMELRTPNLAHPALWPFWLAFLLVGWGTALGAWLGSRELRGSGGGATEKLRKERRDFILKVAGTSLGAAVAAWGLARLTEGAQRAVGAGQDLSSLQGATPAQGSGGGGGAGIGPASSIRPSVLRSRFIPAAGTRPDVTPNATFYRIDIDTLPPVIQEDSWVLTVSGLFDRPRSLTFPDLLALPAVTQPITLCCISNPVGGDLISTSQWTGVPLPVLLRILGLRPEAKGLFIRSADGFYGTVTPEDMLDPRTLLVYGMNGKTLPVEHGFPLRIYIPNRYGMKQPKWIVSMEAVEHAGSGYWEDRGWSREARPQILSIIDTVAKDHSENGKVPVGGIAWAGDRGIQKVEVQVDDQPWAAARLQTPPLGPLTWVIWRYDWPAAPGRHVFRVRATDGTGALQVAAQHGSFPDGATGYDSATVTI